MGRLALTSETLTTAVAGTLEWDSKVPYFTPLGTQRGVVPGMQYYLLNSLVAGSNATGNQSVFGLSTGVTLSSSTIYRYEFFYVFAKSSGTTIHTMSIGFTGTATNNWFAGDALYNGTQNGFNTADSGAYYSIGTSPTPFPVTNSQGNAAQQMSIWGHGSISVNAGGTFLPVYALSAAPGGAYSTYPGSYFLVYPVGTSGSNISVGTWA